MILKHTQNLNELPFVSEEAIDCLLEHKWPGNVRELENVVQRALVLCSDGIINIENIITDTKLNQFSTKEMMETSLLKQMSL